MLGKRLQLFLNRCLLILVVTSICGCVTSEKPKDTGLQAVEPKVQSPLAWKEYRTNLYKTISGHFSLPTKLRDSKPSLVADIRCKVDKDGNISQLEIVKTSKNKEFDDLVLGAVQASSPLPPPPSDLIGKKILLKFNSF